MQEFNDEVWIPWWEKDYFRDSLLFAKWGMEVNSALEERADTLVWGSDKSACDRKIGGAGSGVNWEHLGENESSNCENITAHCAIYPDCSSESAF